MRVGFFLVGFRCMCMHVGTREEENHWFAIKTCAARSTRDEISDCVPVLQAARAGRLKRVQLAWASNGSLETVRNSGVPGSLYTKPRNRENAMSAQSIATGNPETGSLRTTDKTRFAPFYRNDHLYSIFFFLPLFRVHEWSVQGVLCKSRTWQYAQEGVDNVMSLSVQKKIWIRRWKKKTCPSIFAVRSWARICYLLSSHWLFHPVIRHRMQKMQKHRYNLIPQYK